LEFFFFCYTGVEAPLNRSTKESGIHFTLLSSASKVPRRVDEQFVFKRLAQESYPSLARARLDAPGSVVNRD